MGENRQAPARSGGISMRSIELVVAVLFFGLGALVVYDSYRLGASWAEDGPQAGYFPFYIGLIICISTAAIFAQALLGRAARSGKLFVEWQPLRQVMAVFLPALLYVAGIQLVGTYVASAVYIAVFMIWLGGYSWFKSAAIGFGVAAVSFATFEIWFKVPLFKGAFDPLAFLGY